MDRKNQVANIVGEKVDRPTTAKGKTLCFAVVALVLLLASLPLSVSTPRASATLMDQHILRFEAVPAYINLNMRTSIEVEIQSLNVSGSNDYRVTVMRPDSTTSTAWYNFTSLGVKAVEYGNSSNEFGRAVDQVGTYDMSIEHVDGTDFESAGYAQFSVTDELVVVVEGASASNEYTDNHNCPIAQEFQRGGEIIARAYVWYASTGEFVNGTTNPSAKGKITGTIFGETKILGWHNTYHFWRAAWFPAWDTPTGVVIFNVTAQDGKGNQGVGISPSQGLTAWKIIPAILKVVLRVRNSTGAESTLFARGETVMIDARVTYEGHKAHNRDFPGPLTSNRGGQVTAILGYGPFNVTSGEFEQTLVTLALTQDPVSQNWVGTYIVGNDDSVRSDMQVLIQASDGTNPPNTGMAFGSLFSFVEQPSEKPPPIIQQTTTGLDTGFAILLFAIALVAGIGMGVLLSRRGRSRPPSDGKNEEVEEEVRP